MKAPAGRERALAGLGQPFDVLVVGGGVNGLAIAWDCALSGARVLVVDKGDWGSGTSSWSSRMVHGGLKYLEKADVTLVRESLRDREWLLRFAPHLVKPLPFVLPFYRGGAHSPLLLRLGMIAYDILSFDKSVPRHRTFGRARTLAMLPGIKAEGLVGAARYYDAQVEYSERLCVELALAARAAGAVTLSYARVSRLRVDGTTVTGADLVDGLTGTTYPVDARVVVNVAGPWVDDVLAGTAEGQRRWIGGTKGTHLVVDPFPGAPADAMYYESDDGRPMMIIPWLGRYLIGSTDERFAGDLDTVSADDAEIDYILYETTKVFPGSGLTRDRVLYWYTGVRPLPYVDAERTADISRRHEIHDHAPALEGLLSVIGGKLTTFRALARHTHQALRRKGIALGRSRLGAAWLPGRMVGPVSLPGLAPGLTDRLTRIYGARAAAVVSLIAAEPWSARVLDGSTGLVAAEVLLAVRDEEALHLADVLHRRVMVGWEPDLGRGCAEAVADVMAAELGWDGDERAAELDSFERYLTRFQVVDRSVAG